jgi:predicted dehydrogenase
MSKLRFGVCGMGFMGRGHFDRIRRNTRAEVVAVCDQDESRRRGERQEGLGNLDYGDDMGASMEGIRGYATWQELVADAEIDAVVVTLPTSLHAEVTVAALESGKHVLCEKPMGLRAADCDEMIRAQEASGRTLMVAQCIRFWPQYEKIQQLVGEGRIGDVRFATLQRVASPPGYSLGNWLMDAEQSGGAILDLHVHDVDFVQQSLGLPAQIYARGSTGPSGGIDHVVATYAYEDGRFAVIEGGWAFDPPWPFDMAITVVGERGTLSWRMSAGEEVLLYTGGEAPEAVACPGDALQNQLDYFVERVARGEPVSRCSPASTRTSIALAWLERRSVESGKLVHLGDRLRSAWGG